MRLEYEIVNHGVDSASYFPGAGVAGTEWENVATGIGWSARVAGDDALEQLEMTIGPFDRGLPVGLLSLRKEIHALPDDGDAHDECEMNFNNEWCSKSRWTVTRQRPWDGGPAEEYIEISPGTEHASPGQLTKPSDVTSGNPDEIVETALRFAAEYKLPIYFASAECGCGAEDAETAEALEAWTEGVREAQQEKCERDFERWHESCDLHYHVTIYWRVVP